MLLLIRAASRTIWIGPTTVALSQQLLSLFLLLVFLIVHGVDRDGETVSDRH
jgi:hypothetical protein